MKSEVMPEDSPEGLKDMATDRPRWWRGLLRRTRNHFTMGLVVLGVVAFLAIYLSPSIIITIRPGEAGVLYRRFFGGTVVNEVYGEGTTLIAPWDQMFIYNVRVQDARHEMQVLTAEGVPITLCLSIRYHPEAEFVALLHQRVGPKYPDVIVIPEVEGVVRSIMGRFLLEEIYNSKREVVQRVISQSAERVSRKYVIIDGVIVREVTLPKQLAAAVAEKMTRRQQAQGYQYRLEAERREASRKLIEAEAVRRANGIIASSLTPALLQWRGIAATEEIAKSKNAKVIIIGGKSKDLPVLLNAE